MDRGSVKIYGKKNEKEFEVKKKKRTVDAPRFRTKYNRE